MTLASRIALMSLLAAAAAPVVALAAPPQTTFMDNCSACHQATGKGIKGAFPALAGSPLVQGDPAIVTATVLNGRAGMPAFKDDLTDIELAGVLTYIRTSWGNKGKPVSIADVKTVRKAPPKARGLQAH
jgi:mono/diheme cytochrome c family protein